MAENRFRNWALGLVIAAVALEVAYLAAANFLLNSDLLRSRLNRNQDRLSVQWSSAWTAVPGMIRVRDLQANGQTQKKEWDVAADDARCRVALSPLFFRTVRITHIQGNAVTFGLHKRAPETAKPPNAAEPKTTDRWPGWKIAIASADITGIRDLEINDHRFTGEAWLKGDDIHIQPGRPVSVKGARFQLRSGALFVRSEPYAKNLRIDTDIRFDPFSTLENRSFPAERYLSGSVDIAGDMTAIYDFIRAGWLKLSGTGALKASLHIKQGTLIEGTVLSVHSPDLIVRLGGEQSATPGGRYRARGAGTLEGRVLSLDGEPKTQLRVALHDVVMNRQHREQVLWRGESLELAATTALIDLTERKRAEPVVNIAWKGATIPDVAVLNDYLPASLPFNLGSGSTMMSGRLEYADRIVSGALNLVGEAITGTIFGNEVLGRLDLNLILGEYALEEKRLDLSGTSIGMQAAATADSTEPGQGPSKTEINLPEAWLAPVNWGGEQEGDHSPEPVDGAMRLNGSMANVGFFNRFLPDEHNLQFEGNGAFTADLQVMQGRVVPGSAIEVTSGRLKSRFLDFEASGPGKLNASLEGSPLAPSGKVGLLLSNLSLRRLDEPTPYIQGNRMELVTVGRYFDTQDGLRDLDTTIKVLSAEIPDISVYNAYLPPDAGIAITSGEGRIEADLRLKGVSGSGTMELEADGVVIQVRDQTLKGNLRITTLLEEGNLEDMTFDASGTQLRIEDGQLETAWRNSVQDQGWWGQIDLEKARMTWKRPLDLDGEIALKLRDSGLLVHLFVEQTRDHQWLDKLLTINDVTGRSGVMIDDKTLMLKDAELAGEEFLVLANLRLREKMARGALYARYGDTDLGVELRDDEREWKLLKPRQWYDEFTREPAALGP